MITADPLAWYQPDPIAMGQENHDDLVEAITNPDTVRAMIEDYRASLHVDRANDLADRDAGRRIACPTLVAWSSRDDMETLYGNPARIWEPWCQQTPHTAVIDSGHHMAEQNPQQLTDLLLKFFRASQHEG